jgi:hypothetical protein
MNQRVPQPWAGGRKKFKIKQSKISHLREKKMENPYFLHLKEKTPHIYIGCGIFVVSVSKSNCMYSM